jgi:hypothetical protein
VQNHDEMSLSSRDPPGKGRSYPLKRSALDAGLEHAGVTNVRAVFYQRGAVRELDQSGLLLDAMYSGPDSWPSCAVVLRIWSVPSSQRHELETLMLRDGLPQLCAWLVAAENATETWRNADHRLTLSHREGKLVARGSHPPARGADRRRC